MKKPRKRGFFIYKDHDFSGDHQVDGALEGAMKFLLHQEDFAVLSFFIVF